MLHRIVKRLACTVSMLEMNVVKIVFRMTNATRTAQRQTNDPFKLSLTILIQTEKTEAAKKECAGQCDCTFTGQ